MSQKVELGVVSTAFYNVADGNASRKLLEVFGDQIGIDYHQHVFFTLNGLESVYLVGEYHNDISALNGVLR